MVTAADLIAAASVDRIRPIEIGDLKLYILRFGATARTEIVTRARSGNPMALHEYIALALCDENGTLVFDSAESAMEFAEADGWLADKIAMEIARHSKLLPESSEQAAKN